MTDKKWPRRRNRQGQRNKPLSLELSFGPLVRAKDNTFSTTVFVDIFGWWEGGRPNTVELHIDQEVVEVELYERSASYPLVGLEPESHHVIAAVVRGHRQERLLFVPPLPKPKRPEEEALELEKIELERTRVAAEITTLTTKPVKAAKKLYVTFTGEGGRQRLVISISDEAGNFVPDAPLVIVDGESVKSTRANGTGKLVYPLNFTERDRYVEVRAGNEHDLIWRARLNGPAGRR